MSVVRRIVALLVVGLCIAWPSRASAQTESTEALFERGSRALSQGEYNTAIDAFEALSDRGFVHPDASFDRGLAYIARVRAKADKPGDLGRAAAGFEEALELRPDDRDAEFALDLIRAEVTRRRSRRANDAVEARPTLDRVLAGLATERTWAYLAFASSLLVAVGLVLRKRSERRVHVAGSVLTPVAAVALLVVAPLGWWSRELRLHTRKGVIVATEAPITTDDGRTTPDPIPEAAEIEVRDRRGAELRVRWGAMEGWVPADRVRLLAL